MQGVINMVVLAIKKIFNKNCVKEDIVLELKPSSCRTSQPKYQLNSVKCE